MTDNEIIKAMEQVIKKGDAPIGEHWQLWITTKLAKDILDCINRQKSEIERLEKKANTPFAKITFDRDKLQEIVDEYVKNIEIDINLAKSEAIKEFTERLKENYCFTDRWGKIIPISTVDNLVKEMTEVNENDI